MEAISKRGSSISLLIYLKEEERIHLIEMLQEMEQKAEGTYQEITGAQMLKAEEGEFMDLSPLEERRKLAKKLRKTLEQD